MSEHLYHEALMRLARDKSHAGRLEPCDGSARADNPLCGDRVTVDLRIEDGRIAEAGHVTRGCILTQAAAAMVARRAQGRQLADVDALEAAIARYLRGEDALETSLEDWPEMADFAPVRAVKSRHDCVLIAFQALREATDTARESGGK